LANPCPACARESSLQASPWTYRCAHCGHWTSTLTPDFSDGTSMPTVGDDNPLGFLDALRRKNFTLILNQLDRLTRPGPLLDIGCGPGLFLDLAYAHGHTATGVEPKPDMAAAAQRAGHSVRTGEFPAVLRDDERFAVIVFNDVLEHIGNLGATLDACRGHLQTDGILVVNVPNARGVFFRLALFLKKLGINGPFERLWQTMFYSPHLHYFTPRSLAIACENHGFSQLGEVTRLESVTLRGLWARISADASNSTLGRVVSFVCIAALIPLLRILPPDAMVGYFKARV
jgi:SAM-dependent methyltransferase